MNYRLSLFLLTAAFLSYFLSWVVNPPAGLTLHAYDLAEWTSLHPQVRGVEPILMTTALLRIPMLCLAIILALMSSQKNLEWLRIIVLLIAVGLLPPLEFVRQLDNANYRQQFLWSTLTIISIGVSFLPAIRVYWKWIATSLAFISIISGIVGLYQAMGFMQAFMMPANLGIGGVVWVISMGAFTAMVARGIRIKDDQGSTLVRTTLSA